MFLFGLGIVVGFLIFNIDWPELFRRIRAKNFNPKIKDWEFSPTEEDLKKYPTLKTAWEEYKMIQKLTGK